jgi:hypothetical protein
MSEKLIERMLEEAVVAYYKFPSRHLPEGN